MTYFTRNESRDRYNEIVDRLLDLRRLTFVVPAKVPTTPEPNDIDRIREDLVLLARVVDDVVAAYGEYLNANTGRQINQSLFKDQLTNALKGNALYECKETAQYIRDQKMERA